jgi:hypothetical protein
LVVSEVRREVVEQALRQIPAAVDLQEDLSMRQRAIHALGEPDRPGKLDGAVFEGVFEPGVNDHAGRAAVETRFQLFFRDAGNRHG